MPGDASLLAMGANNFAIGVDFAGYGRVSAVWNGLWGFRPTYHRFETSAIANSFGRMFDSSGDDLKGVQSGGFIPQISSTKNDDSKTTSCSSQGSQPSKSQILILKAESKAKAKQPVQRDSQKFLLQSLCFLSKCPHDLTEVLSVLSHAQKLNLHCPPIPWQLKFQIPHTRMKIGVIRKMPFIEPCKAALRAVDNTIVALLEAGYEVYDVDIDQLMEELIEWATIALHKDYFLSDLVTRKVPIGEPLVSNLEPFKRTHCAMGLVNRWALKRVKQSRLSFYRSCYVKSQNTAFQEITKQQRRLSSQISEMMLSRDICALLSPALSIPAVRHGESRDMSLVESHLYVWDFINMPNGVAGLVTVREDETDYETGWKDKMAGVLRDSVRGSQGMAVGVSVAGLPFEDELVVKVMCDVKENLGVLL